MFESLIDGFHVRCAVEKIAANRFEVQVLTRKEHSSQEHLCKLPGELVFECREDAERRARYVLLGVREVDALGEPSYVVI
jgi:hypothetical protein